MKVNLNQTLFPYFVKKSDLTKSMDLSSNFSTRNDTASLKPKHVRMNSFNVASTFLSIRSNQKRYDTGTSSDFGTSVYNPNSRFKMPKHDLSRNSSGMSTINM